MDKVALPEPLNFDTTKGWWVPSYVENSELLGEKYDPERSGVLTFHGSQPWKMVTPGPDTLARFLTLADASPRELLRFARKFGPLGVQRMRIRGGEQLIRIRRGVTSDERQPDGTLSYFELTHSDMSAVGTSMWRTRARRTKHLIEVAQRLHASGTVSYAEWKECDQWVVEGRYGAAFKQAHGVKPDQALTKDQTRQLAVQFDAWLRAKKRYQPPSDPWERLEDAAVALIGQNPLDISMRFSISKGRLAFSFATCLWDYLAVQTLHAIGYGASTEMVMCSNSDCREMFKPTHRIPEGKRAWCRKCGTRAAAREAMRRFRAKSKSQEPDQQEIEV